MVAKVVLVAPCGVVRYPTLLLSLRFPAMAASTTGDDLADRPVRAPKGRSAVSAQQDEAAGITNSIQVLTDLTAQVSREMSQEVLESLRKMPTAEIGDAVLRGLRRASPSAVAGTPLTIASLEASALEGRRQMAKDGEIIPLAELAKRLALTRQALNKAQSEQRLFFLPVGADRFYPAFWADPELDRPQLERISRALGHLSGWSKWQFFTRPKGSLGGRTPLEMLKAGQLELVERCAKAFLER